MHDEMKNVCFDQSSGDHGADGMALGSTDAGIAPLQQSVDAGPAHTLLSGRAQADAAHSLAMRPAENVPVYVMLPLDTVRTGQAVGMAGCPTVASQQQAYAARSTSARMPAQRLRHLHDQGLQQWACTAAAHSSTCHWPDWHW